MALARLWAGKVYGTNTGNLFVKLQGEDAALSGVLRMNDTAHGLFSYNIEGRFDGSQLSITGQPQTDIEGLSFGRLNAVASLSPRGELIGQWETDIGSAGTFVLLPHEMPLAAEAKEGTPDQLHTARHDFGAVAIDREQVTAIAEEIQRGFSAGTVVITFKSGGTQQARFLDAFRSLNIAVDRAESIKIHVQELEPGGTYRMVTVEFSPQANWVMTQSADEAWARGMLDRLKCDLKRFEQSYATNIKRLGVGINQLLLLWAIIYLPSLSTLKERALFMGVVLAIALAVKWLHERHLPFAAIYLSQKHPSLLTRVTPSLASWLIAVTASVVAGLVSAYLQGWLKLPGSLD